MTEFKRTQIVDYKQTNRLTADDVYWKRLDFPVTIKEFGFINGLDFSPVAPYHFAVSHSTKVDIYDPSTNKPCTSLTRFKSATYGSSFRRDGKLLAVGGEEGRVKLFSIESKSQLRSFKGHEGGIHACKFLSDNLNVVSFSDDRTVRRWDIATGNQTSRFDGHTDYVRCGVSGETNNGLIVSGSYDHTVRIWDTRQTGETLKIDHGHPVEAVLMFPNDSLIISAGGTFVKVWDIAAGGRALIELGHHHKTITSLCFSTAYRRLLSASLDRHVKIYDTTMYQVVHTLDYPAAVVKIGISADDETVVAAMVDGLLSIQHRQPEKERSAEKVKLSKIMSYRFLIRKNADIKVKSDIVVKEKSTTKLANYDQYLRTFQHTKALNAVLTNYFVTKHPEVSISVIRELMRRQALRKALAGRSDDAIRPIIKLIINTISRQPFSSIMIDVANDLLDLYADKIVQFNDETKYLLRKMNVAINREVAQMRQMSMMIGVLQLVQHSATSSNKQQSVDDDQPELFLKLLHAPPYKIQKIGDYSSQSSVT